MRGMLGLSELVELIDRDEIDTVLVVFPDHLGRLIGKRVTGRFFLDRLMEHGMPACNYLLTVDMEMNPQSGFEYASWDTGYGDFRARPDMATLRRVPWLEKTALVMSDLVDEETADPVEVSPRQILRRQVERATQSGLAILAASELEFYLYDETYRSAREKRYGDLTPGSDYVIDYHIMDPTKDEGLIRQIRNAMSAGGVPVEFSKGEWGLGQHEINLQYAKALEMADRHVIYKNGAREMAAQADRAISFMAKVDRKAAGSSCHVHISAWDRDARRNVFSAKDGPRERCRPLPGGLTSAAAAVPLL